MSKARAVSAATIGNIYGSNSNDFITLQASSRSRIGPTHVFSGAKSENMAACLMRRWRPPSGGGIRVHAAIGDRARHLSRILSVRAGPTGAHGCELCDDGGQPSSLVRSLESTSYKTRRGLCGRRSSVIIARMVQGFFARAATGRGGPRPISDRNSEPPESAGWVVCRGQHTKTQDVGSRATTRALGGRFFQQDDCTPEKGAGTPMAADPRS